MSRELRIPLVATNVVHYIDSEDALAQEVLLCLHTGKTLKDSNRMKMSSQEFFFRGADEMWELFKDVPEAADNTLLIASRADLELEFGSFHLPSFTPPDGSDPLEFFRRLCEEGVRRRYPDLPPQVRERLRAEMEVMRGRLRRGEIEDLSSPESWTQRYRELSAEFDELVKRQREVIVKDEMDRIYTRNGGEFMNAGTTEDFTIYFITVPANKLELWFWMESDRLGDPVFREFYSERDVVYEERRLRVESTPTGRLNEAFNAMFWAATLFNILSINLL